MLRGSIPRHVKGFGAGELGSGKEGLGMWEGPNSLDIRRRHGCTTKMGSMGEWTREREEGWWPVSGAHEISSR